MADPIEPDARGPQAPEPSRKAAPDTLTLRAAPRRVVRFRRGVIIGGATAGAFAIAGVAWMALGPKTVGIVSGDDGKAITERHTPADEVMNLPGDYRKVTSETPILGAPLPGDLGGPILARQRQLGLEPASTTGMTHAEQASEAERQRLAAPTRQAREHGVRNRPAGGPPAAPTAAALDAK